MSTSRMHPTPRNIRLADEDLDRIEALGKHWGPVRPLSLADVVRVAVRRAHDTELGQGKLQSDSIGGCY